MDDHYRVRAWQPNPSRMLDCVAPDWDGSINVHLEGDGEQYRFPAYPLFNTQGADDLILMKCTGLPDKNKRLMYEGDILRDRDGDFCIVKWDKSSAAFVLYYPEEGDAVHFERAYCLSEMEVVGNIYENAELIQGELTQAGEQILSAIDREMETTYD